MKLKDILEDTLVESAADNPAAANDESLKGMLRNHHSTIVKLNANGGEDLPEWKARYEKMKSEASKRGIEISGGNGGLTFTTEEERAANTERKKASQERVKAKKASQEKSTSSDKVNPRMQIKNLKIAFSKAKTSKERIIIKKKIKALKGV